MKKIISLVLALALVCGLAVNAFAANLGVSVDKDVIEAGDTVTVTVTLDEEITGVTSVQAVLTYDKDALTYVEDSAVVGEGYSYLSTTASKRNPEIKINSGSDFSVKTMPAGTVVTLKFTANEAVESTELALAITMKTGLENGDSVDVPGASVSVVTCPGHNYIETKSEATCLEPATVTYTCEYCGDTYAGDSEGVYGDHNYEYVSATNTCTEDGLKEHYVCTVCGKFFEAGQWGEVGAELTEADLFAPAAHTPYNMEEWMEDGTIVETPVCAICEEVLGDPVVVHQLFAEDCPTTINVAAGETVNYNAIGFGGYSVLLYGDNLTVTATSYGMWGAGSTTETYTSVNGVVTIPVSGMQARLAITNNGGDAAVEVKVLIPAGDYMNPAVLYDGTNSFEIPADCFGYYTSYTPYCDGTLTVTVSGEHWSYTVQVENDPENWSDGYYGEEHWVGDEEVVATESVDVKAGYPAVVILGNYYKEGEWDYVYPAGTVNVEVSFVPTHNIVHVDAKAPSCFEEGNIEYWYCDICGTAWANEELTQITNLMSVVLPAACPDVQHVEAKAPSCFEEGNIEYWYCTNPEHGTVWIDEDLMQISNHMSVKLAPWCQDVVHVDAVEPGCHYEGNVEHWYCTNPEHGTVWTDVERTQISNHKAVILPALGGEVVHVEAAEATCTEAGHIEYWYCEECEQVWQDEALTQLTNRKNVITEAAHGHVYDDDKDMVCNVCEFDRTNSQTGDVTILVAAAAAVISATGAVALPIAKKKFF